jgi:hypothetical protein
MEPRIFNGTATSQLGPLAVIVMLAAPFIWRFGLDGHLHLNFTGYVLAALIVIVLAFVAPNVIAPATLSIDDRGMTWKSWRYSATFPWSEIDRFWVGPIMGGGKRRVAFDFLPGKVPSQIEATSLNRALNGYDRSMNNVWNISTLELVELLNSYVERSRQAQVPPEPEGAPA